MIPPAPYLWGAWRANANPGFFTGWCPGCGMEMWLNWTGSIWQVVCMNDERRCAPEEIEEGAERLLAAQRQRYEDEREAKGALDADDLFYGLSAEDYIEALTGRETRRGFVRCPFHGGGEERTPSLHVTGVFWHCQACHLGGTIYDFGAQLWGIRPRGDGFKEIRERLLQALLMKVDT